MVGPLIHIGYHKTGTNWLQRRLFRREDLNYRLVSLPLKRSGFIAVHDFDFDPEEYRREFAPILERRLEEGGVPVISRERLSGNPHSGGYDSKKLADRVHRVFPDAKILIVIREQRAMILSAYAQYVKVGGGCSLRDYVSPPGDYRQPMFSFDHFKYDRLIAHYQKLFGTDRVLVQPYERFRETPRAYVQAIADFCGAKMAEDLSFGAYENPSRGPVSLSVKRRLNPFFVRNSLNANSPFALRWLRLPVLGIVALVDKVSPRGWNERKRRKWREFIGERTAGYYTASNRTTSAITGLDLGAYGYMT